ncbi:MAG: NADH:ubiquinone reductase (Na(+)-transporting) subunit C [Bacteroidia bacterium]
MNKNSSTFTFTFAAVMVIIVATLLASAAIGLKPMQDKNAELEKKQNILSSVNILVDRDAAEKAYNDYIVERLVINNKGEVIEGDPFIIDLKQESKKAEDQRAYPLFVAQIEGKKYYIIPMRGKGLWGPIWGYLALEDDFNTIYGVSFDHKGETPGLGAEIATAEFQKQFKGKKIMDNNGGFVSVKIVKGGGAADNPHGFDGISGGTITSVGLSNMLENTLANYIAYFKSKANTVNQEEITSEIQSNENEIKNDTTAVVTTN